MKIRDKLKYELIWLWFSILDFFCLKHNMALSIEFEMIYVFFYFRPKSFTNNFSNSVSFRSGANVEFSGPNFANTGVAESQGVSYTLHKIWNLKFQFWIIEISY